MFKSKMVPKGLSFFVLLCGMVMLMQPVHASEDSTPEQAQAHAEKAAAYVREHGVEKATEAQW